MNINDRIKAAQEQLIKDKDALHDAVKMMEDTPDDESIMAQVDSLTDTVEKGNKQIDMLKKAEAALAERAKNASPAIITSTGRASDAKELWVKEAVCSFLAHAERKTADQVRAERYTTNKALETFARAKSSVPLATTFDTGWAAELTQDDVQGFINVMTPLSVAMALASRTMVINFGGYDTVTIPRRAPRAAGQTMGGAFVGEGGAIPLGRAALGAATLARYKMGVISTFSKELATRSTPTIESVIRQAILDDTSMALDSVFLGSTAAVAGIQPAGIMNGVTPVAGTAGGGIDAVVADIKALVTAMMNANLGTRPVLLVNSTDALALALMQTPLGDFQFRDELSRGSLLGIEVIKSLNIPNNTCILVDAATIATALDPTMFEVSDVASIIEANADATAPTHAVSTAGVVGTAGQVPQNAGIPISGASGAGTTGYKGHSLWQTNSIGVKAVTSVSWGLVYPGGVFAANNLTW